MDTTNNESPEASVELRFTTKANIHVFADAKAPTFAPLSQDSFHIHWVHLHPHQICREWEQFLNNQRRQRGNITFVFPKMLPTISLSRVVNFPQ